MDYKAIYENKLMSIADAAAKVESGWMIGMDAAAAHPAALVSAIAARARAGEISGVKIDSLLDVDPLECYADPELNGKFNGVSWFTGG